MRCTEPTEAGELSGRVLRIIGSYEMGAAFDPRDLRVRSTPTSPPPTPVHAPDEGYVLDGVYHVGEGRPAAAA